MNKALQDISFSDFDYLRPPNDFININHSETYKKHEKGEKSVRKIFHYVEYDDFEKESMIALKAAINEEKISLPSDWIESDLLKYCYSARFKIPKCLKSLKKHLEWKINPKMQTLSQEALEHLEKGVIYTFGRDKSYRPIVVFNVSIINFKTVSLDSILTAFCFLLTLVSKNMFVPGKIENWIIIIECNNLSLLKFPFGILKQVIECMSNNYVSTAERIYILHPPTSLYMMWKMIEGWLDPETSQKIKFLKKSQIKELLQNINPNQLEEKYGGEIPELKSFWPPKSTFPEAEKDNSTKLLIKSMRERMLTGCQLSTMAAEQKIIKEEQKSPKKELQILKLDNLIESPIKIIPDETNKNVLPPIINKNNNIPKFNEKELNFLMDEKETTIKLTEQKEEIKREEVEKIIIMEESHESDTDLNININHDKKTTKLVYQVLIDDPPSNTKDNTIITRDILFEKKEINEENKHGCSLCATCKIF